MPWPSIPTETRRFVEFIRGANAFYRGHTIPWGFGDDTRGYLWASKMHNAGLAWEARHATVH